MPEHLSGLLIRVTGTPPWLFRPVKVSTSSELYSDCFWLPFFVQASSFLIHSLFPSTCVTCRTPCHAIGHQVILTQPSSTCVIYGMPCRARGHQALPIQPLPREAEDFSRGGNHSKHVPLHTYLA